MATYKTFEELDIWQRSRLLTHEIYSISNQSRFGKDFVLQNQIRKASISVMSNIAEGFERSGTKEFVQFLAIAKGSLGEIRSQLYVALDQEYITKEAFFVLNWTLANYWNSVILSAAKNLFTPPQMLRQAQHDTSPPFFLKFAKVHFLIKKYPKLAR